jgi:hypothetical protein
MGLSPLWLINFFDCVCVCNGLKDRLFSFICILYFHREEMWSIRQILENVSKLMYARTIHDHFFFFPFYRWNLEKVHKFLSFVSFTSLVIISKNFVRFAKFRKGWPLCCCSQRRVWSATDVFIPIIAYVELSAGIHQNYNVIVDQWTIGALAGKTC